MTLRDLCLKRRTGAFVQALYFMFGGLWAVAGKRSFEDVTGPKADYWLVRTVGGLLTVIGVVIAGASIRDRITAEIRWLGFGASSVLAAITVVYTAKGRIRPIYLLDAGANLAFMARWLMRDWHTLVRCTPTRHVADDDAMSGARQTPLIRKYVLGLFGSRVSRSR